MCHPGRWYVVQGSRSDETAPHVEMQQTQKQKDKMISKWCNLEGRGKKTNLDWMVQKNFTEEAANKEKVLFIHTTSQVKYRKFNMKHQKLVVLLLS